MKIKGIILTEKSQLFCKKNNIYTFHVSRDANKFHIKKEIEHIFKNLKIKVKRVRTLIQKSVLQKSRILNKFPGKIFTKVKKKAFVELFPGQTLPIFHQ